MFDMKTDFARRFGLAGAMLATGLGLAACNSSGSTGQPDALLAANDYRLRHPIVVGEAEETLDLPIGYTTRRLGRHLSDSVTAFAQGAVRDGNGRIEVLVPAGAGNEGAVHAVTPEIRTALSRGGVSKKAQLIRSYPVDDPNADAPIRLSYARVKATVHDCGEWPQNLGGGIGENSPYHNFGCASQANLAAMVENPADLLSPRASTPADQQRRATVYEKYREGTNPSGEYTEGVGAEVADN